MIGSGDPTIGNKPKTIDILIIMYKKIANANPRQKSFAKKLLERKPILIILKIMIV